MTALEGLGPGQGRGAASGEITVMAGRDIPAPYLSDWWWMAREHRGRHHEQRCDSRSHEPVASTGEGALTRGGASTVAGRSVVSFDGQAADAVVEASAAVAATGARSPRVRREIRWAREWGSGGPVAGGRSVAGRAEGSSRAARGAASVSGETRSCVRPRSRHGSRRCRHGHGRCGKACFDEARDGGQEASVAANLK